MIRIAGISKSYEREGFALEDISFHVPKGNFVFITGLSGAGKSTLLSIFYGTEAAEKGQVFIAGRNITRIRRRDLPRFRRGIGVVFQDFILLLCRTRHKMRRRLQAMYMDGPADPRYF